MASQAQVIHQKFDRFLAQLDKELSKYPALNRLDRHLPVPKSYLVVGTLALFTILVFFNIAAGFLTNFIGFVVPTYFSMAALETPQPQDDVQWLTYWVVFGFFNFIESFVSIVLYWFPFYYTFKTLAIIWLVLPQTQGAKLVYHKLLRPAFLALPHATSVTGSPEVVKPGYQAAPVDGNLQ
ncbi:ER membrane protein DP1/Yop1 [Malassezia sp. CBS 17886]|nr:ER membrane protein DP1/Yop1 [Malassezia sp. CBS 17886]